MSASPESFSSTRLKLGSAAMPLVALSADLEAGEAGDADVLAGLRGDLGAEILDRLALVALLVEVLLIEQDDLGGPLLELPFDDLLDDVVGLAVLLGLLGEDAALVLAILLGDLVEGDVLGVHRGDVDRDLPRELLKVLVAGDELRLALDL